MITRRIALFLSLLFAGVAVSEAAAVQAKVQEVKGDATFSMPNQDTLRPLRARMRLKAGSRVVTGKGALVVITVTPGAAIRISEESDVVLSEMYFESESGQTLERRGTIDLRNGTLSTLIQEGESEVTDFKIRTPQGSAAARGTFYGVVVKDGQTFVECKKGKVGFQKAEQE